MKLDHIFVVHLGNYWQGGIQARRLGRIRFSAMLPILSPFNVRLLRASLTRGEQSCHRTGVLTLEAFNVVSMKGVKSCNG